MQRLRGATRDALFADFNVALAYTFDAAWECKHLCLTVLRSTAASGDVTGQAERPCAPLDRADTQRTVTKKWLWISYPWLGVRQ